MQTLEPAPTRAISDSSFTQTTKANIAVVCAKGLGDGLLFLTLANNLALHGFSVTVYSNLLAQLRAWLPNYNVQVFPQAEQLESELDKYDLVISDAYTVTTAGKTREQLEQVSKKYVFMAMARFDSALSNYRPDLQQLVSDELKRAYLQPIVDCHAQVIYELERGATMASNCAKLCREGFKLPGATLDCGLRLPNDSQLEINAKQVLIHPTSATKSKNWSANNFIKLARKLRKSGWKPVFSVSPAERPEWLQRLNNEFELPELTTIKELAMLCYSSAYMIGNDSGTGHLCSCLGLPTLTIHRRKSRIPHRWRPGWARNRLVTPITNPRGPFKQNWSLLIPVGRVYHAFCEFSQPLVITSVGRSKSRYL